MQTERTLMQLFTPNDISEVLELFFEEDTFKYIAPLQNKSREEYVAFLNKKLHEIKTGTGHYWVVRLLEDNSFIGAINLTPIPNSERIQIGWQFKRKYWGQGYAYEAAKAAFDFGVNDLKLEEIYGVFVPENLASEKILSRLGFSSFETKKTELETLHIFQYKA